MSKTAERVLWHVAVARTDTELVRAAVWLEQLAALAYDTAAEEQRGGARRLAAGFAAHERAHAAAMETVLQGLTLHVRSRPAAADVDFHLPALRGGDRAVCLASLAELEGALVRAYRELVRRVAEPAVLRTVATVVAGGAQHLVALRRALGEPLVPA